MTLDCVKCNQTIDWEGDEPEPEDCLCGLCLSEERDALKDRVAELAAKYDSDISNANIEAARLEARVAQLEKACDSYEYMMLVYGRRLQQEGATLEAMAKEGSPALAAPVRAPSVSETRENTCSTSSDSGSSSARGSSSSPVPGSSSSAMSAEARPSEAVQKQPIGPCVWHRPVRPDDTRCPRGTLGCVETHPYDLQRPNDAKPHPFRGVFTCEFCGETRDHAVHGVPTCVVCGDFAGHFEQGVGRVCGKPHPRTNEALPRWAGSPEWARDLAMSALRRIANFEGNEQAFDWKEFAQSLRSIAKGALDDLAEQRSETPELSQKNAEECYRNGYLSAVVKCVEICVAEQEYWRPRGADGQFAAENIESAIAELGPASPTGSTPR